jgi:hypothetical protein
VNRERRIQFFRFFVNRPINFRAVMAFNPFAIGRQHRAGHAQFVYGAPELGACSLGVLDGNESHALDARRGLGEFLVQPIVVGATSGDGPILGDDAADRQTGGWIYDSPIDSGLVQKVEPFLWPDITCTGALLAAFEKMKMNVIEGRKNLRAISRRHELGDLVHTRPIIDMAVSIDDLHAGFLCRDLFAYNNLASSVSMCQLSPRRI